MECQYVATQRGGIALLFEGHRYNKVRDGKEGTIYWRCARDRQCPGRAVTVYSRIKKANNKHNHPPDTWRNKVDQVVSDLKLRSQEDVTTLPTLFTETLKCLAANPQMATLASMVPSLPALKSSLYRTRHRRMPTLVPFRDYCPDDEWVHMNNVDCSGASTSEPLDMAVKNTGVLLKKLRSLMKNTNYVSEVLHAYIIPDSDSHQTEYLAPCDRRRAFITGFTGNYGTAIVTDDHAALWTSEQYFQQAEQQLDHNWTLMKKGLSGTPSQCDWISRILPIGSRIGVDPYLISFDCWQALASELEKSGHHLVGVNQNLVDFIWDDRPALMTTHIEALPVCYTGKCLGEKIAEIRQEMTQKEAVALVITALDEIAWLFNLRGSDVDYNPVFFAYSIITLETIYLFIDENKLTTAVRRHLQSDESEYAVKVEIRPYKLVKDCLGWLVNQLNGKIWISTKSSFALVSVVPRARRVDAATPVLAAKSVKNEVEVECMRRAHVKDGVAVCEFFAWLSEEVLQGEITELMAASKLEEFRSLQEEYVGCSFETISASGTNAADVHYHPNEETYRVISSDELYLCDCGAHYRDGTTNIARTVHFGTPSQYEKECFTRVVKGHIAVASAIFPRLTKGQMLDTFARRFLWEVGLDYPHITGRGVGVYLNVHEDPVRIGCKNNPDDPGLQEGMIISAEPAYYEEGQFGIRIKNVIVVKMAETKYNVKEHSFLTFEPLTLVPIQVKLLEPTLLTVDELEWLDNYHQTCRDIVGRALKEQGKHSAFQWLLKETQPIG